MRHEYRRMKRGKIIERGKNNKRTAKGEERKGKIRKGGIGEQGKEIW